MNKTERRYRLMQRLQELGFTYDEANQLRRIEMTLHRWAELECGDSNSYGSWCIERDECDSDCQECTDKPYMVHHHYGHASGKNYTTRTPIADREKGALKRLDAILARHPGLIRYQQTDPRGCALYILRKSDLWTGDGLKLMPIDANYTRGLAVCD